jgi:PTS system mannose-specific IIA component
MVGILILTHGDLGIQFINTARLIGISSEDSLVALSINPSDSPDAIRDRVSKAIRSVNSGGGVLILTDLFGGTPTNISLTFMEEGKVEVVTGLNLPMILKAVNSRNDYDLVDLARMASDAGKESIYLAGELLRRRRLKKQSGGK